MRKTKKEKIESAERREKFLYSLSSIQQAPLKEEARKNPNQEEKPMQIVSQPQILVENFSYLKTDLKKTAILALMAFAFQIVLYLTIF